MTNIRFDYSERAAYDRFMKDGHTFTGYIDSINVYLKNTKHDELTDVSMWDTSTHGDKVFLTYYYAKNDSYKKLDHMQAIERILSKHYSLVDFQEFDGDHVRLELSNEMEMQS